MSRARRVAYLLAILVAAGCSGGDEAPAVEPAALGEIVLQPADLRDGWVRFDVGEQAQSDVPLGVAATTPRQGRLGGWKARYRRPGSPETPGPLVVESRTDVFEDEDSAEADFERIAAGIPGAPAGDTALGDEAAARTLLQPAASSRVRFFVFVWRDANVTASVVVNGFDGKLERRDALALARAQARRIERAMR